MSTICASQVRIRCDYIKLLTYKPSNLVLNLVKTNSCLPQAQYLSKTFEILIKIIFMLLCAAVHHYPIFLAAYFRT